MFTRFKVLPRIYTARLSWKIVLWVFASIVTIEILILIPAAFRREGEKLLELQQKCALILKATANLHAPTTSNQKLITEFEQAEQDDLVLGGVLYDPDTQQTLEKFGSPPDFTFEQAHEAHGFYYLKGKTGEWYDVAWQPLELKGDYLILRLDASPVNEYLQGYVRNIALLILLISAFVTTATMMALGPILLIPILQLRKDLMLVGDFITQDISPDKPPFSSQPRQDEFGDVIVAFQQMLHYISDAFQERQQAETELQIVNETLEQRVQERTQALSSALEKLQDTQMQLIQTEKMSSLGQMVAGVAHEINNPINFIQGNVSHLKNYFGDLQTLLQQYQATYTPTPEIEETISDLDLAFLLKDAHKALDSLNIGTRRVQEIVAALRNFSRLDEAEIKEVDIHEGLESTLLILNHRLRHGIEVLKDYEDLPLIQCYPAQLNQVFTNIIANAIDAIQEAGRDEKRLEISTRKKSDKEVEISFEDTGCGISEEIANKIFDPFFTTKSIGKGTGLGLGICHQIIHKHSGHIKVESEVGRGTRFEITLPTSLAKSSK